MDCLSRNPFFQDFPLFFALASRDQTPFVVGSETRETAAPALGGVKTRRICRMIVRDASKDRQRFRRIVRCRGQFYAILR